MSLASKNEIQWLTVAIEGAIAAGKEIMEVYQNDFEVETKADESPLTIADKRAHFKIADYLNQTNLPILSEEGKNIPFEERKDWVNFWMVDPLDGTKEFIKRNGEFTVNIALIQQGKAVGGVIYVPVKQTLYVGLLGYGAFRMEGVTETLTLETLSKSGQSLPIFASVHPPYKVVGSRSHMSPETEAFVTELKNEKGEVEMVSMGSSLKICLVAEGSADVYPRFAPTMEWDTAAGQAIAEAAGCTFIDYSTQQQMRYNKENLLNNWFLVRR
jgi:3'(2'), 5'-bisphosphate nucleotidase